MRERRPTVLIVDDDDTFRSVVTRELRAAGFVADAVSRGDQVEEALLESTYDVVVLDLKMRGMDGIETLERIKSVRPLMEVIILTGHGSFESAVQALKLGAYDFLSKPCNLDHLESVIRRAAEARAVRSENVALRQALRRRGEEVVLVGRSAPVQSVLALINKVAPTDSTVLIRGESGVGKEVVARMIHGASRRDGQPLVVLDCAATQEHLVLSGLFGHEKGAFTGASERKHGLFELADSGTILIDEVGDAPISLQKRLLRVLETGMFHRLGSEKPLRVDVRVLAATNQDLEAGVRAGTFREDLYYRLNVVTIDVPSLRERPDDIPLFLEHFLAEFCPGNVPEVDPEVVGLFRQYRWPGNVRELRNVIERAVILSGGGRITLGSLPSNLVGQSSPWVAGPEERPLSLDEMQRRYLESLLERYEGRRGRVAALLGISERTLYRKLRARRREDPGQV